MFTSAVFIPHLEKLRKDYVERFNEIGYALVEQLPNQPVTVAMMCEIHDLMVKEGKLEPIYSLSEEKKQEIFDEAKVLTEIRDRQFIIKLCKAIYTLGQIIQM